MRMDEQTPTCNTTSAPPPPPPPPWPFWLKSNFGSNWHCNSQLACPELPFVSYDVLWQWFWGWLAAVGWSSCLSVLRSCSPLSCGYFWSRLWLFADFFLVSILMLQWWERWRTPNSVTLRRRRCKVKWTSSAGSLIL